MRIRTVALNGGVALAALIGISALAGTASAQSMISVGQTVTGQLTSSDPVMKVDGSSYDCHILSTRAGQTYTIDLQSNDFDTFIGLGQGRACQPPVVLTNDDRSEDDTNALLTFTSEGGDYFILANSYAVGETGTYRLTVTESSGGTGAAYENLTRPTDAAERYDFDMTCSAFGTLGMIELMQEELSDDELQRLLADNYVLITNAEESGAAIGRSAEDVSNDVADLAAGLIMEPDLMESLPPVALREACLRANGL